MGDGFVAAFGQSNEGDVSSHNLGTCCKWTYSGGKMSCPQTKCTTLGDFCQVCTGTVGDCGGNAQSCLGHGKGQCSSDDLKWCQQDIESAKQSGKLQ